MCGLWREKPAAGTQLRILREEIHICMSRMQIGYALQDKDPVNAVWRIQQRYYKRLDEMSVEVKGCQFVIPCKNFFRESRVENTRVFLLNFSTF